MDSVLSRIWIFKISLKSLSFVQAVGFPAGQSRSTSETGDAPVCQLLRQIQAVIPVSSPPVRPLLPVVSTSLCCRLNVTLSRQLIWTRSLLCAGPAFKGHGPALSVIQYLNLFYVFCPVLLIAYSGRVSLITHYSIMTWTIGLVHLIFDHSVLDRFKWFAMFKFSYGEKFKRNNKINKAFSALCIP